MSVQIRLDAPAVRHLIESDPEFRFELNRAVVAEIVRNVVLKDAGEILAQIAPAVHAAVVQQTDEWNYIRVALDKGLQNLLERDGGYWSTSFKPTAATKARIDAALTPLVASYVDKITQAAGPRMQEAADKALEHIDERVDKRIYRLVDERVTQEVDRRVKDRLDAMFSAAKASI